MMCSRPSLAKALRTIICNYTPGSLLLSFFGALRAATGVQCRKIRQNAATVNYRPNVTLHEVDRRKAKQYRGVRRHTRKAL